LGLFPGRSFPTLVAEQDEANYLPNIGYWTRRFIEKGILHQTLEKRFDQSVLPFTDRDGMALALVGIADAEMSRAGATGTFPPNMRSAASQGVTLLLNGAQKRQRS